MRWKSRANGGKYTPSRQFFAFRPRRLPYSRTVDGEWIWLEKLWAGVVRLNTVNDKPYYAVARTKEELNDLTKRVIEFGMITYSGEHW